MRLSTLTRVAGLGLLLGLLPGCGPPRVYYELGFVQVESAQPVAGGFELVYRTPVETMYHSPGVDVVKDGDALRVYVVRAFHRDDGDPDRRAEALVATERRVIVEAQATDSIVLCDGREERPVWPASRARLPAAVEVSRSPR